MLFRVLCVGLVLAASSLLAAVASADLLQYDPTTLRVTGYTTDRPIAPVPDRVVVEVPAGFLGTLPQPATCAFAAHRYPDVFRVATVTPFTVVSRVTHCFAGMPVFWKHQVDEVLTDRLRGFQRAHFAFCPADDMTPACIRIRATQRLSPADLATIDTLYQQAETVKGQLP